MLYCIYINKYCISKYGTTQDIVQSPSRCSVPSRLCRGGTRESGTRTRPWKCHVRQTPRLATEGWKRVIACKQQDCQFDVCNPLTYDICTVCTVCS